MVRDIYSGENGQRIKCMSIKISVSERITSFAFPITPRERMH